jgi:hypothetical protein
VTVPAGSGSLILRGVIGKKRTGEQESRRAGAKTKITNLTISTTIKIATQFIKFDQKRSFSLLFGPLQPKKTQ